MLLVLSHGLDAVAHLHFHGAWQEQLALLVALVSALPSLDQSIRVGLLYCTAVLISRVKVIHIQRMASRRGWLVAVVDRARTIALVCLQSASVVSNGLLRIKN